MNKMEYWFVQRAVQLLRTEEWLVIKLCISEATMGIGMICMGCPQASLCYLTFSRGFLYISLILPEGSANLQWVGRASCRTPFFMLKLGTNEKVGGSERWQMSRIVLAL
jgi:hypothetical protein